MVLPHSTPAMESGSTHCADLPPGGVRTPTRAFHFRGISFGGHGMSGTTTQDDEAVEQEEARQESYLREDIRWLDEFDRSVRMTRCGA